VSDEDNILELAKAARTAPSAALMAPPLSLPARYADPGTFVHPENITRRENPGNIKG
jgi:hypothetical protein